MNFIGYRQLHRDVAEFSAMLPRDLIGIIGVPRSGLMVASLLALHRNLPLGCLGINEWLGHGMRALPERLDSGTILLLDDSLQSGGSMRNARRQVEACLRRYRLVTGALYVDPGKQAAVDYCLQVVPRPRVFAWNWISHARLTRCLSDIDGVLCYDPPVFDDDGPEYQYALCGARPLHVPTRPIGGLVTGRLSRWRELTEGWLASYGVRFGQLTMYPAETATERQRRCDVPHWKGRVLRNGPWDWMVESSAAQAPEIARVAGKPVICLENERVY
jgi:uncharacterized HAD superfamily protein/hypoxanthine phosphoribosyltransferase